MGTAAVEREATQDEIDEMCRLLAEGIRSGGLGFSTTLARTHSDGDGKPVASRWASEDELLQLAAVVAEHPGTTLEFASDGCLDGFEDAEVDFMIKFSTAGNRPLNWNVLTIDSHAPERYRNQLAAMDRCAAAGAKVVALTMPVIVGMNMSFLTYCALNMMPDWGPILGLPVEERIERLRDPETRTLHAGASSLARDGGLRPPDRLGHLRHRRHLQRRQRRPDRSAGRRHRRRTRPGAVRHAARHRRWRTTCARCCGRERPMPTPSPGNCGVRPGNTPR